MIGAHKRKAIFALHTAGIGAREISRRSGLARNTVRRIIEQKGQTPQTSRREKFDIDAQLLKDLYKQCDGNAKRVRENLVEDRGIEVSYPTLTRMLRELGLSHDEFGPPRSVVAATQWLIQITFGAEPFGILKPQVDDLNTLGVLRHYVRNGRLRERKKAVTILAVFQGIPISTIAKCLHSQRGTLRAYLRTYRQSGTQGLFGKQPRHKVRGDCRDTQITRRILEILHQKPASFGVNRTSWTQPALRAVYEAQYDETVSQRTLARLIKGAGYTWRRASHVLTSPDPEYKEKVSRVLRTLHSLGSDEMFFFLDEWGPIQVRKRGGKAYRRKTDPATVPRRQKSKGTVTLVGALSATTNQVTWLFEPSKDTRSMINLIEVLHNQHHKASRLYVTWDAVGWHSSLELTDWLDAFNETSRRRSAGPLVELVPLPTSAQFLNVIEGVFTAMTKAVIHNSDYQSADEMKSAISRHFRDRNAHFDKNPRRAGKKIWDLEFFRECETLESGNYGKW